MTTLFVSHSGKDRDRTAELRVWLKEAGYDALFVDFDPEDGIGAGRDWERELYAQLRTADAVVFLATAASTASRWCFAEVSLARALGRPVFPIRAEPGASLALLADRQWVDLAEGPTALTRLRAGLDEAGLGPDRSIAWDPGRSPYPGLASFEAADAAVFFGRDHELDKILGWLQPTLWPRSGRFLAIVGPSGSGKSSLMRAGLLPRLARAGRSWVVLPPMRPGTGPTRRLAACLADAFTAHGAPRSTAEIAGELTRGADGLVDLARGLADAIDAPDSGRPGVLVVIDQAEELLRLIGPDEQATFLRMITGALREDSPVWVVATVRSEFLSTDPERAGLARAIDDSLLVEPLDKARLAEVIARPARRAGVEIELELITRMVEDTAGGDALPLLAYTLSTLYARRGPDARIDDTAYDAVGGVIGALQQQADQILAELTRHGLGATVVPALLQLAAVDRRGEPGRRRVRRGDLTPDERAVVDAFVEARLLSSTADPGADGDPAADADGGGNALIDVAHEALLRQWSPLRMAIDQARTWLVERSELDRLATDWERSGRDESFLLRGGRLATYEHWATEHGAELGPLPRDLLAASRTSATHELEEAHRVNRHLTALTDRLRSRARVLLALLVVAAVAGGAAWYQSEQASTQTRLAGARQLAAHADRLAAAQPDLAVLTGLQSLSLARGQDTEPPAGLVTGLARLHHRSRLLVGHTGPVRGVAFVRDGSLLATAGDDGTARLWVTATGTPHGPPLVGHTGSVTGVAFHPDGTLVATSGADATVRLWDAATGRPRGPPLSGHTGSVTAVVFSPDRGLLATSGSDATVRLWDAATGRARGAPLTGHVSTVHGVAFSPDSRTVAGVGADFTARLWDTATGLPRGRPLTGHSATVRAVAFSPDGRALATAGDDTTVRLWDTATGRPRGQPLRGHGNWVQAVAFSPDGRLLATAGADASVRLWDAATGRAHGLPLAGHANRSNGVAFTPDGAALASAGDDQTVRVWDVAERFTISRPLTGHTDAVRDVALSPDGRLVAGASRDRTVRLWDAATGLTRGPPLVGHTDAVAGVAFSPDGTLLASAGWDATVRLWDARTGRPRGLPLTGHTSRVDAVAFGPDGRTVATASVDTTVRLWDVARGRSLGPPLTGHTAPVRDVTFSPDGRLLATAGHDLTVRLWDARTGRPHGGPLTGHTNWVNGVAFSPDGTLLASTSDDLTVRLWDTGTGRPHGSPLTGHTGWIRGVAFAPDGSLLATGGHDRTVRLWDLARGEARLTLTGHTGPIRGIEFGADGRLATAGGEGDDTVRLWDPGFRAWATAGCELVGRNLSAAEWNQFAPGRPYQRTCGSVPAGPGAPPDADAASFDE